MWVIPHSARKTSSRASTLFGQNINRTDIAANRKFIKKNSFFCIFHKKVVPLYANLSDNTKITK